MEAFILIYAKVYAHPAVKGVELMIGDILSAAGGYFGIFDTIKEINKAREASIPLQNLIMYSFTIF